MRIFKIKKIMIYLLLTLCLCSINPISVSANKEETTNHFSGDINDFGVTITEDGVKYDGDLSAKKSKDTDNAWTHLFEKYKGFIVGVGGILTLTMLLLFIKNFMHLGVTSGNPQARQQVLTGLIITGLATAGLGSVTTFVALFYYILR